MTGVDGYTFTGRILAWGAERAAAGGLQGTGALGPADALRARGAGRTGCRQAGISEQGEPAPAAPSATARRAAAG